MFKNRLIWIPVILWMMVIFYLSHQVASESNELSMGITKVLFEVASMIFPSLEIELFNHVIRKNAHFIAYFILGLLTINAIYWNKKFGHKAFIIALIISILYAVSDEIHQLFIPGRAGRLVDVLIDAFGAFCGIGVYTIGYRIIKHKRRFQI